MATTTDKRKHTVTIRVPRSLHDRVRTIAERDFETHSAVIRRLIRRGLDAERQEVAPSPSVQR